MRLTNLLNFAKTMVGGEESFAISKALKLLFQHFSTAFSACYYLTMLLLKRWKNIEKGNFYLNSKQGSLCPDLCLFRGAHSFL